MENILVFILEERGGTVTKKGTHKLISELFEKARPMKNVNATVENTAAVNNCTHLLLQIVEKDISEWEMIFYYFGRENNPILLSDDDKRMLPEVLASHRGTSAEAIFDMLRRQEAA